MENAFERRPWLVPLLLALRTFGFLRPAPLPLTPGEALNSSDLVSMVYPLNEATGRRIRARERTVTFTYRPVSLFAGAAISAAGGRWRARSRGALAGGGAPHYDLCAQTREDTAYD